MANHDLDKYRTTIKEFIRENISDDDFDRTDNESWDFEDIDDIYELNDKMVDKCNADMLIWLINLIKLIKKEKIYNMDKDLIIQGTMNY